MAAPAWSAGVTGAYELSSMAGKMGQIVQRLCRVQFRRVPFYAACYKPSLPFLDELIHPQHSTKIFAKKERPRDFILEMTYKMPFIMVSAIHQFEHTAKSKCEMTTEILHKCPKRSIPLSESLTPSRLSSRMQPITPPSSHCDHEPITPMPLSFCMLFSIAPINFLLRPTTNKASVVVSSTNLDYSVVVGPLPQWH